MKHDGPNALKFFNARFSVQLTEKLQKEKQPSLSRSKNLWLSFKYTPGIRREPWTIRVHLWLVTECRHCFP